MNVRLEAGETRVVEAPNDIAEVAVFGDLVLIDAARIPTGQRWAAPSPGWRSVVATAVGAPAELAVRTR